MKIDAQPSWLSDLEPQALNSLSINDSRNRDGSDEVLIAPAFENTSDDEISSDIDDILSSVRLTPKLREIEDSNRSKLGPRSIAKPWVERRESLYAYFDHASYDPGSLDGGKSGVLRPTSLQTASEELINSSSAGLPYLVKKGSILTEAVNNYESQVFNYPCVLYTRTQEKGKTRNVWGYPIADTLFEGRFFHPYLRFERTQPHRAALLGPTEVDRAMTSLLARKGANDVINCLDFSAFDASVTPNHTYECFQQIASVFQPAYAEELYRMFARFVTIPIWTPDGEVTGYHGVPSGSMWTNTVDSLAQYLASGGNYTCQIQGDDGVFLTPKSEHDSLLDRMNEAGFTVNEEKSDVFDAREAVYLQRYYHPDYVNNYGDGLGGVYSLHRAVLRLKYLERWSNFESMQISGADFFALRAITILENCKHHPGFQEFVKYVRNLDRHNLSYTEAGLDAYSRSMDSKARAGVFNQYGMQKGINAFETVKLLKRL